ncbi:MAG: efflux transporter periplasmic adaptor subunit [Deltaproteobacteria bacterium]|nr:MAG: efflux transporter periplasmic adaptor subunit [Deltaproteobacteria bacterium]
MKVQSRNNRARRLSRAMVLPALWALLVLSTLVGLTGCGDEAREPAAPQAPPVTVASPEVRDIRDFMVFTGTSHAAESAEVMARVTGTLKSVEFRPSTPVKAGDLLFTIEDTRYRALRDAARAALASAQANLERSEVELKRVQKAGRSNAVSDMDVDRAKADRDMARASVSSAQAALDEAELNLGYTQVRSPIDGVVSRSLVDRGNLVGQAGPTPLTRVNALQPIYVYFHASESALLSYLAQSGRIDQGKPMDKKGEEPARRTPAYVELANETGFPREGVVDYIDNEVDARTGTIELRARLENEDGTVFPGLFVRVKVEGAKIPDAVLVPETAVGSDLGGKYVLTVGEDNIVQQIYVRLGAAQGDGTVHVRQGLRGDETIIINGQVFARPGAPVPPLTEEQMRAMGASRG